MQKRAIILINAKAGSFTENDEVRQALENGFKNKLDIDIRLLQGSEIIGVIKTAVAEKPDIIVAGGGDGTINAVASQLLKTDIPLGILPLGTLNHFAKDAGIPQVLQKAIENIIEGNVVKIDVAEVNGRMFLNNSSLGIYPNIVAKREEVQSHGHSKWTSFTWAFFGILKKYPMVRVHIETEGENVVHQTPFVFIGNNQYIMEGFAMGGRERLTDGKLSLFIIHKTGRLGLLRLAFKALFGMIRQDKDFNAFSVSEIFIESDFPVLKVSTDGEVNEMKTPLLYKILPKTLNVIVPS